MNNLIFNKIDKGREEIVTRQYRLASRLRSLLVLIDGKKSTQELLHIVAGLGLDASAIVQLIDGGFIANTQDVHAAAPPADTVNANHPGNGLGSWQDSIADLPDGDIL
jgi:hypothetical protein